MLTKNKQRLPPPLMLASGEAWLRGMSFAMNMNMGNQIGEISKQVSRTWNSDFPLYNTSSIWSERPWPGHMVLSSVNHPSFAALTPASNVPAAPGGYRVAQSV